jgi:hypothetical protein
MTSDDKTEPSSASDPLPENDYLVGAVATTPEGRVKQNDGIARTLIAELTNVPELKDDESYLSFTISIRSFLRHKGWWQLANGDLPRPTERGERQDRWDFVNKWASWSIRQKIDTLLSNREELDEVPTAAELLAKLKNGVGKITPQMTYNLRVEFNAMKLADGEDPGPFFDRLKAHRRKMENYGVNVDEPTFIQRIINALGEKYYMMTIHLHDKQDLTAAMLMANVTSSYQGLKVRNLLPPTSRTPAALNATYKRPSDFDRTDNKRFRGGGGGGAGGDRKECERCKRTHGPICFKWDSYTASEGWKYHNGEWREGRRVAERGKWANGRRTDKSMAEQPSSSTATPSPLGDRGDKAKIPFKTI